MPSKGHKPSDKHPDSKLPYGSGFIPPLDGAILALLPKEGTVIGYKPLGMKATALAKKLELTSSEVSSRLRVLHLNELVAKVTMLPVSEGMGWQITVEGEQKLAEWKKEESE